MFKSKKSEFPARFLFHQALYNNKNNHKTPMAYLAGYDPCSQLSRTFSNFHSLPSSDRGSYLSFPYLRNLVYANVFGVGRSNGFSLKGCSFDTSGGSGNRNDKIVVKANARPRIVARPLQPFLADFEQGNSARSDGLDTTLIGASANGSPTKLVSFRNHHLSQKVVVAVDVDEVLGNFVSALNKFIADRYSSSYSVSEYHVYEFCKIWNCSRDEADIRVHEFFKTPYFKTGIHPLPGAQKAIQKLSRFCSLSVVTSRQNVIKDHTIQWIEKNFPGLFHEIHFGNHFALDGVSRPKSEICRYTL
ncbi:hypothetical protein PIB30_047758 [Stylosanthes scabra]|uniref:Uncharacterized protein n=1 Tax=Stylosanthes scabra TaxID=79078 RepID=A0ABU6QGA6_9FABA|nr:hypothetical protein [Stylosanthes scabra]